MLLEANGENSNKTGIIAQVYKEDNELKSKILAPFDINGLQLEGGTCSPNDDFRYCKYKATYPATWNYVRIVNDNFIEAGDIAGIIFLVFGCLQIVVELFFVLNLIRHNKYWDTVCLPYVTVIYPILSILLSITAMVQIGKPSDGICSMRNYFDYTNYSIVGILMFVSSYYEVIRSKRREPPKSIYRIETGLIFFGTLFAIMSIVLCNKNMSITDIDLSGERPYYDMHCQDKDYSYVFIGWMVYLY